MVVYLEFRIIESLYFYNIMNYKRCFIFMHIKCLKVCNYVRSDRVDKFREI